MLRANFVETVNGKLQLNQMEFGRALKAIEIKSHKSIGDYLISLSLVKPISASDKGPAFRWNPDRRLWIEYSKPKSFGFSFSDEFLKILEFLMEAINMRLNELRPRILKLRNKIKNKKALTTEEEEELEELEQIQTKLNHGIMDSHKMITKLGEVRWVGDMAEYIFIACLQPNILNKMNRAPGQFPISGGWVLDIRTSPYGHRERSQYDYFTHETEVDLDRLNNWEVIDPIIYRFLTTLMGEHNVQNVTDFEKDLPKTTNLIRTLGYQLSGTVHLKICPVLVGPKGDNGKSLLVELLSKVFGQWVRILPKSVILKRSESTGESPAPALFSTRFARAIFMSEFKENEVIDDGMFKNITGHDTILCRDLYSSPVEFRPMFVPAIQTNEVPHVELKRASLRRLFFIVFGMTFYEEGDPKYDSNNPKHAIADQFLEDKLSTLEMRTELFKIILFGAHEAYIKGINTPEDSIKYKEKYQANLDTVQRFVKEGLADIEDEKYEPKWEPSGKIYNFYKSFCESNKIPRSKILPSNTFGKQFKSRLAEIPGNETLRDYFKNSGGAHYLVHLLLSYTPKTSLLEDNTSEKAINDVLAF